jgi:hypothetical protein
MADIDSWFAQLDDVAAARADQTSFHVFAEGTHSDLRGQIFRLAAHERMPVWTAKWPRHVFVILAIRGSVDASLPSGTIPMREMSQLVVLPGTPCELHAVSDASIQIISLLSTAPPAAVPGGP